MGKQLPDAWGAAVEKWIEARRGGELEPHLLALREALPQLYELLVAELFAPAVNADGS